MAVNDLEEAAHAALTNVRTLQERVLEARSGCEESSSRVANLSERFESDREVLRQAVSELDKSVEDASRQLSDDVVAAEEALTEIATASHQAGAEGQQALDIESSALEDLAQHLHGIDPQLTALAGTAAAASRAALERAAAIVESLSQVVDDAEQLLFEFASALAEMGREVEDTATAAVSLLEDRCLASLQEKQKDFEAKTDAAREVIDRVFEDMRRHAGEVAAYGVETFGMLVGEESEEMKDIETQAQALESDLVNLTRVVVAKTAEIERAGEAVVDRQWTNDESAKALGQRLDEFRVRWALFGFSV